MLADRSLSLGPFSIPVRLLFALGGLAIGFLFQRLLSPRLARIGQDDTAASERALRRRANDLLTTTAVVALLVWKLTPLLTRFDEIRDAPVSLLYYPGGAAGVAAAAFASAAFVAVSLLLPKRRPRSISRILLFAAIPLSSAALASAATYFVPSGASEPFVPLEATFLDGSASMVESGRPTILVYWATWCVACGAQMPEIERAYQARGDEVRILAVNMTSTEPSVAEVRRYADARGLRLPIVLDSDGRWTRAYEVSATPTLLVFDANGELLTRHVGAVSESWLDRVSARAVHDGGR